MYIQYKQAHINTCKAAILFTLFTASLHDILKCTFKGEWFYNGLELPHLHVTHHCAGCTQIMIPQQYSQPFQIFLLVLPLLSFCWGIEKLYGSRFSTILCNHSPAWIQITSAQLIQDLPVEHQEELWWKRKVDALFGRLTLLIGISPPLILLHIG